MSKYEFGNVGKVELLSVSKSGLYLLVNEREDHAVITWLGSTENMSKEELTEYSNQPLIGLWVFINEPIGYYPIQVGCRLKDFMWYGHDLGAPSNFQHFNQMMVLMYSRKWKNVEELLRELRAHIEKTVLDNPEDYKTFIDLQTGEGK